MHVQSQKSAVQKSPVQEEGSITKAIRAFRRPLTVDELAGLIGVHKVTLYRYVKSGILPAKRIGAAVRFDPGEVAAWWTSARAGP